MSNDLFISTATESAERCRALPTKPSEDVSQLLGKIECPQRREERVEYGPNEEIEWVVEIAWEAGIPREAEELEPMTRGARWDDLGTFTRYGKDAATGRWTFLISADGPEKVTGLKLGWDYFSSLERDQGPADRAMFEERLAAVQEAAAGFGGRAIAVVDPSAAAIRAARIANLYQKFDADVILQLKAPLFGKFEGRKIWDVMLCLGLKWGDMDLFHWHNPTDWGHDFLFSVWTSTAPGYFFPEEVAAGKVRTEDLIFSFSLPRSANPEAVFLGMWAAAEYAQKRLGGTIRTAEGERAEKESLLESIKRQAEEMREAGIEPGSGTALRMF